MALSHICRFYGYTLEQVGNLTFQEFEVLNENMVKIIELENPNPDKKPQKAQVPTRSALKGLIKKG